jgi:hypothetical protein
MFSLSLPMPLQGSDLRPPKYFASAHFEGVLNAPGGNAYRERSAFADCAVVIFPSEYSRRH